MSCAGSGSALRSARVRFEEWVKSIGGSKKAAGLLGCSRSYVDMIIGGVRRPGLVVAAAIERASAIPIQAWMEPPFDSELAK